MSTLTTPPKDPRFAIFCEAAGHDQPLIMHDVPFGRLVDETVIPLQENKPFFVDGASLKKDKVRKLKILLQTDAFPTAFTDLHWGLRRTGPERARTPGEQYHTPGNRSI